MTELSPAGQAALQAWAAHCFQAAFIVGLCAGVLASAAFWLGRELYARLAEAAGFWKLNCQFRQWERTPEAAVLRKLRTEGKMTGKDGVR